MQWACVYGALQYAALCFVIKRRAKAQKFRACGAKPGGDPQTPPDPKCTYFRMRDGGDLSWSPWDSGQVAHFRQTHTQPIVWARGSSPIPKDRTAPVCSPSPNPPGRTRVPVPSQRTGQGSSSCPIPTQPDPDRSLKSGHRSSRAFGPRRNEAQAHLRRCNVLSYRSFVAPSRARTRKVVLCARNRSPRSGSGHRSSRALLRSRGFTKEGIPDH